MQLATEFEHWVAQARGAAGRRWLGRLEAAITAAMDQWDFRRGGAPFPSTYGYVMPGRAGGEDAVLKAAFPGADLEREIQALHAFAGEGAVRLLAANPEDGLLLIERAVSGQSLASVGEVEAVQAFCAVARRLRRTVPENHPFPDVKLWTSGLERLRHRFDGGTGPFPDTAIARAEALFAELLDSSPEPALLHGDLHHTNVLAARREPWLAIDPKGVIGDPAYEAGAFLRNHLPRRSVAEALRSRTALLAAGLQQPEDRILKWAAAQAVLAAWWSFEDHGRGHEPWLRRAERLFGLIAV